jgi:agmatinase
MKKKNIFGGSEAYCSSEKANVIILPVPFELNTSYVNGTKNGPEAILNASTHMELYDEELDLEPCRFGIYTSQKLSAAKSAEAWLKVISSGVMKILIKNKFPVILGGEHTASIGAVNGCRKHGISGLSVLQLDAHADLRDTYEGNKLSHACVGRRISEVCPLTQVGIRSLSRKEAKFKKNSNVTTFYAPVDLNQNILDEIVSSLTENVYITIDLDVFDPAFVPAVGTPEPGGLNWYEILKILHPVIAKKNIIGFDIVELCPLEGHMASDFLAAKLVYKLIGYISEGQKKWKN